MEAMGGLRSGMPVHGADGRRLGAIERLDGDGFVAAGQRLPLDAVERVEGGAVYLWGDRAVYAADAGETPADRARLPNTDAPLYLNERPVEESLEERMPRDGRR